MSIYGKLLQLIGQKEDRRVSEELERYNYLIKEIQGLKLALVGENLDGIPSGVLRLLLKQNQEIYWAIKENDPRKIGDEIVSMINQLSEKIDNLSRQEILEVVRDHINQELSNMEMNNLRKKIVDLLHDYEKLTKTDLVILLGERSELVEELVNKLVYEGILVKEKSGKFLYYRLAQI